MKRPPIVMSLGLTALWLAAASACSSTGVGNPGAASLSLAIVNGDSAEPEDTAIMDPEPLEPLPDGALEQAVLVFGRIRWLPCAGTGEPVVQSGPFVVDLLAGLTRPPLPPLEVPEGGFCGFDASLASAREPAELAGRSLFFSGVRADGVEFVLFANVRATLRLRAAAGQAWGMDGDQALLWGLRPRRWAAPMELGDADAIDWTGGRRTVVIDANRHPLLFARIRARLASQSGIFLDRDLDGVLDAAERQAGELGAGTADPED